VSGAFHTTRWTMVLAAGGAGAAAERALGELCALYREPLLAHGRRRGLTPTDAEDAVQGFFARLLRGDALVGVRRERGRFRAFLLGAFNHHLSDLRDRERAEKRGGGRVLQLDTAGWAGAATEDAAHTPDAAFDRVWALALLATTLARLRAEHSAEGRAEWFDALVPCLGGRNETTSQAEAAARLGVSEAALRVAVHRLRKRYREVLRMEVAQTVADPSEVEAELRHLLAAVASGS
jgi:DNA-directed RNA polymerase specialized sigma24 family protein